MDQGVAAVVAAGIAGVSGAAGGALGAAFTGRASHRAVDREFALKGMEERGREVTRVCGEFSQKCLVVNSFLLEWEHLVTEGEDCAQHAAQLRPSVLSLIKATQNLKLVDWALELPGREWVSGIMHVGDCLRRLNDDTDAAKDENSAPRRTHRAAWLAQDELGRRFQQAVKGVMPAPPGHGGS